MDNEEYLYRRLEIIEQFRTGLITDAERDSQLQDLDEEYDDQYDEDFY